MHTGSLFASISNIASRFSAHQSGAAVMTRVGQLIDIGIVPLFNVAGERCVLTSDLADAIRAEAGCGDDGLVEPGELADLAADQLRLSRATRILLGDSRSLAPGLAAGIRNLLSVRDEASPQERLTGSSPRTSYLAGSILETTDQAVRTRAAEQVRLADTVSAARASQFANSAYYMGSKRALGSFLTEAMSSVLPRGGAVLDPMCGSGAAAGAFARQWRTYASDAQEFAICLAQVQGGGYSAARAAEVAQRVINAARDHIVLARGLVGEALEAEDGLLHGRWATSLRESYADLVADFPTYATANPSSSLEATWDPARVVAERQEDRKKAPYCLCTAYFANVFFGIRQSVELDSLRYGIDTIGDEADKRWALGALIATASKIATTYGGHFAQPLVPDAASLRSSKFSDRRLHQLVERRALPVMHEFAVRMTALGRESERCENSIVTLDGPWPTAFDAFDLLVPGPACVYLDAPYTRDEYSRYYHVLETLVRYNYPGAHGKGRLPDKTTGERFRSEFFVRDATRRAEAFVNVIGSALSRGHACLWSYSDAGDIDAATVIQHVVDRTDTRIHSFGASHDYKGQGGKGSKRVVEYAVAFTPQERLRAAVS